MALQEFEVDFTNPTRGRVIVGGVDVSDLVTRVSIDAPARQVPTLYLELMAGKKLAGIADVVVAQAGPEGIRAWLTTVNPSALEDAALAAEQATGGPMGPGQMFKAGMLALLDGQHG